MSVHGERAKSAPMSLANFKSSKVKTVPIPILKLRLVLSMSSIAFLASLVLKVISKFLIPESERHLARSIANDEFSIVRTEIILFSLSIIN